MCDCFHLAFPNWHANPAGGRRLQGREPGTEDDSLCNEPSQLVEEKRPRPQGSSPVEEFPEAATFSDSDKEGGAEHDLQKKGGKGGKRSGLGSLFDKRSTPKMSKLKEIHSPVSEVVVKTDQDGGAEGLVVCGGGKDGIFIKQVVPESPAYKNLHVKEGDQILSATVYFDNVTYEDALQIMEHAQAYKVKLCLKRKPEVSEEDPDGHPETIQEEEVTSPEMREQRKTKRHGDARISWPKFPSLGKGKKKSHFRRSHSTSEAEDQTKLELSPTTSDTDSPIKSQEALKGIKGPEIDLKVKDVKGIKELNISKATVDITAPEIEVEGPSIDVKTTGIKEKSLESPDEDLSTACSLQSSDAFADASSMATSEQTGVSFTSPAKVTVKYSSPDAAVELGEIHSNIITSTTRSAQISFEPNLPEKITILSAGVSSSSVDTLKLESDKIHVIRSNIQATPQVLQSTILTNFQVQSPLEIPMNPEFREAVSWSVGELQEYQGITSVERHITREISRSQETTTVSRGTVVTTQQLTRRVDQVEPISDETASSIQRLRDTVHSEKMRFFDGAQP
ncbi:unnamed protein product [Merluccius merluccius]